MAEIKTGIFAKNVQKRLSRAQEKVLQKLGKADETKDEQFEQCVQNFKRQEFEGSRLQREMKAYIAAVKGMQQASMNLTESLHEVYEPDWHGKDDVMTIGKNCDVLWEDFHQKLVDSTINTLETYLTQFPDLKTRVAKRSRKLIDYDSARHHLETLQTSAMRNEKKISKAEEDLKKAQRVFDDLNVGLQDELPTLWDSRVGFYVSTFKNVSGLEARFHREISFLCHKLYEVMNKLAEQHSDKMFTIQGAPSDSGPLRLARTPTPPDDESPDSSPAASPNHTLRPISPGPPRPKSPSQLKMGPPKPPPPKATPTKELQQEQIIDLFDGGFPEISVTSPQLNEKPGESLLDLDFDPFKPDASTPIGQTQSPISQTLPWDLWTGNAAQPAEPAADAGFTANWAADFGSSATTVTEESENAQPALDGQGWPPSEGWPTEAASEPQEEVATDEDATAPTFVAEFDKMSEAPEGDVAEGEGEAPPASVPEGGEGPVTTPPTDTQPAEIAATSPPAETATSTVESPVSAETEPSEQAELPVEDIEKEQPSEEAPESAPVQETEKESPTEAALATFEDKESPIDETPTIDAKPEEEASSLEAKPGDEPDNVEPKPTDEPDKVETQPTDEPDKVETQPTDEPDKVETQPGEVPDNIEPKPGDAPDNVEPQPGDETSKEGAANNGKEEEKMPIPSVVIEPASSNEGDDDRDGDLTSPIASIDNGVIAGCQSTNDISSGMPTGYIFKVETLHDFEAANPDELELKKGDIVLVVPTELTEDQDAGWLTGIRESDWEQRGSSAKKGLFPENFTQRLE
ncbi:amphiphysin isoform X2 [Rhinichthys klamathensis goyatoka]|uniref:amphiphysin isoform X2 n=1 Tax=Rhinichthys klamathensis goyatoka TaxID=3034132 RepID=UPI0024B580E4|nr:amphiphysin isoform X2 [Rhinichthys klamathensis goyatoka]